MNLEFVNEIATYEQPNGYLIFLELHVDLADIEDPFSYVVFLEEQDEYLVFETLKEATDAFEEYSGVS